MARLICARPVIDLWHAHYNARSRRIRMSAIEQLPRHAPDVVAEQMRSRLKLLQAAGSELYPRIAERLPDYPELVAIASRGLGMLPELHLFVAVHYLLMCDPSDPLAQYYATLTKTPAPAKDAFADFRRYCLRHR